MNMFQEDESLLDDEEDFIETPDGLVIEPGSHETDAFPMVPQVSVSTPVVNAQIIDDNALATQAAQKELERRKLEMAEWAEKKKILKGAPKIKELNRVWNKLRKGYPLVKALRGVVSVATWHKWREEYPEIAAMETQCREERVEYLQERIKNVAEQNDRTRVGEVSRDKLMIDAYQSEIDRLDRLTQVRNNQLKTNGFGVVNPIQINFAFGKKK